MRRLLLLYVMVNMLSLCTALCGSAQTNAVSPVTASPQLQARIRQLVALLGPDPSRGTCVPDPNLPTNQAKEELIAIGKPATLPLCAILKEKDIWRRIMAVEALGEIRDRRALDPLLQTLQRDTNDVVQGKAAEALGDIADPATVEVLLDALAFRNRDHKSAYPAYVAGQAPLALGKIGDKRAIAFLLPLLGSREQTSAAFVYVPFGSLVAEAIGHLGPYAAEPLMQALRHPDREVRSNAVKALGIMKEHRVVPMLLALLTPPLEDLDDAAYEDHQVGVEAIRALGEIRDTRATMPLLRQLNVKKLLEESNMEASVVVIEMLGKLGGPRAVETLLPLLSSKDSYVRRRTLEALWRIKTPKVIPPLQQVLEDDEDNLLRYRAAEWLGKLQGWGALPALNKALGDEDELVRYGAAAAIGRLDSDALISLLDDKNTRIRRAAVFGAGEDECKQAVPRLLTLLDDEEMKYRVLDALGKLGTPELLPRLEPLRHEMDYITRGAARRAVIAIKRRYGL